MLTKLMMSGPMASQRAALSAPAAVTPFYQTACQVYVTINTWQINTWRDYNDVTPSSNLAAKR